MRQKAREEAQYVLDMIDQYGWNVSMPIIMDREAGANKRLTAGKLSKTKRDSGMSGICGYHYGSRIPGRRICILCVDQKLYQYGCFV